MKILLANYRYFLSGGPERYMFNITDELTARGHEVIPFSINYSRNASSAYSHYFAPPLGSADDVYFTEQTRSLSGVAESLRRSFYSADVEACSDRLLQAVRPDVAYVLHYLRKLSPSLLVSLKKHNVPIVVRLSDYQMLCPQAHMLRDNSPCSLCVTEGLFKSIENRCVKGSLPASMVNACATWFHRWRKYFDLIDCFVVTNEFMREMMIAAGYRPERVTLIPTFSNMARNGTSLDATAPMSIAYLGRVEPLKGVHLLLEAYATLRSTRPSCEWRLEITGEGDAAYLDQLRGRCTELGLQDLVSFGYARSRDSVIETFGRAVVSVVPSIWFENLPNSLLESLACGVPVVASRIGSLTQAFSDGVEGFHFTAGSSEDLANTLIRIWDSRVELSRMRKAAAQLAREQYSASSHVQMLVALLERLHAK